MPFAHKISFPQNDQSLEVLWIPLAAVNVWRIPILFLVSGMGAYFAMRRRDWKGLLKDRTLRILLPFIIFVFLVTPALIAGMYLAGWRENYALNFLHLWFLANLYIYILLSLPLMVYLKRKPDAWPMRALRCCMAVPWGLGLYLFGLPYVAEAVLLQPAGYEAYAFTLHGLVLGLICFISGYCMVSAGSVFWSAAERLRWLALLIALTLYGVRLIVFELESPSMSLVAFESLNWIFAIVGFGSRHLNRESRMLTYLSRSVFPVYILHMPVQFLLSYFVFGLPTSAWLKFVLVCLGTLIVCYLIYELSMRRLPLRWARPFLGLSPLPRPS